ncbi:phytoene/squalene synthase family protein [Leucobacter insecticola]|uniref:Phytoene/squalene synthase family protein n=1 Tax=Leucobacter insecticola TaxID=2714934 RepID=A0A6G8FJI6_9MICO|nr:phytoene/squalene synthase family protein [Leucobacter insecticola]QIM16535.1 phytoene/squalene synthase family protein [Leucobacter insecticola]
MTPSLDSLSTLERYTVASERSAQQIIGAYSSSFGAATRLLGPRHRRHVRNIYALVRVADELVDGATSEAGFTLEAQRAALNELEGETDAAVLRGYSSNPIVHAFAATARESGIGTELTTPFFASMRADLGEPQTEAVSASDLLRFGTEAHASYVYGSAEVIGLMCLRVFTRDERLNADETEVLEHGARRLGAAFQNVNFLRDLADDTARLGRSYLSVEGRIDRAQQQRWVVTIREQIADARASIPLLPRDARIAVGTALRLFERLNDRLERTDAEKLYSQRVRIPGPEKLLLLAQAAIEFRK